MKAPKAKSVSMFTGLKGLVASGPGTKKMVDAAKVRPEKNEGAMIAHDPMKTSPKMVKSKPAGVVMPHGSVRVMSKIRPEGGTKRDSAKVVKP